MFKGKLSTVTQLYFMANELYDVISGICLIIPVVYLVLKKIQFWPHGAFKMDPCLFCYFICIHCVLAGMANVQC